MLLIKFYPKNGTFTLKELGLVYFHRYFRIVPAFLFIFLITTYLLSYFGNGPIYFLAGNMAIICKKNWWQNFLFIQNLYPGTLGEMCLGHTWYLANDMQFFIITPFFLMLYCK